MSVARFTRFGTLSLTVLLAVLMAALVSVGSARAESKEPTVADLAALAHPLAGLWWLKTIYDETGAPVWSGGGQQDAGQLDQTITMEVDAVGGISTLAACNSYFGSFGPAQGDRVALVPPQMMTTRIMCWGTYPPVVLFERVARFERDPVELRLYDAQNQPIAVYIDVVAMQRELEKVQRLGN